MATPGILARLSAAFGIIRGNYNYDSVRPSPARGRLMHGAPADLRIEQTQADQREVLRSTRYLDKNNGFVSAWVNAFLSYGIGDGLRYQPLTENPEWNRQAKAVVARAMERPEITSRFNGLQFQRMAAKSLLVDGEIYFVKTVHLDGSGLPCVQAIEAHRITQPPVAATDKGWVQGIRFDRAGRPISVAIQQDDGSFAYYEWRQIIHLHEPDRFTGVRGMSRLQVAVNGLRDRAEILSAEKLAVKEFSRRTFVLTSEAGEFGPGDAGIFGNNPNRPSGTKTSANDVAQAFGGLALAVKQGEKLEAFEHNRPSLNVLGMLDNLDRDVANALGISSDFLLNPTKIGGAVVRMELAKAERQFSSFQNAIIDGLLRPFVQYVIATAIDSGELAAQPGWERMTFQTPRRLSVDVGRDTLAMIRSLEAGATNLRDILEESGKEYESEIISRLDDKVWATEQAKARGLTYDDVSLTSILSKPAEEAAPVQPSEDMPENEVPGVEDEPASQEEPESEDEDNSR